MKSSIVSLIAALALLASAGAAQTAAPAKHRVVFQMNMPAGDSWNQVIANVNNIRKVFAADGIQVEIVFYGKGLTALLKTNKDYEERLKQLAADGVILGACQNTMRIMKVTSADIFPFSTEVDSGVAELVRKQEAGWTYIRAGE